MPKYNEPVRLSSEDQILLPADQSFMLQQCCNCSLTHRIEVEGNRSDLWFRWVNIGDQFPTDVEIRNVVREL